jgi:hypothetical protein
MGITIDIRNGGCQKMIVVVNAVARPYAIPSAMRLLRKRPTILGSGDRRSRIGVALAGLVAVVVLKARAV